jgi:ribosomal protein L37AE/L43A
MAGFGTGPVADHELIEDCPTFGVFTLHKAGALEPGSTSTWRWPNGLVVVVCAGLGGITLLTGGSEQRIEIVRLRTRLGYQPLFVCSECKQKRAKVHERGGVWLCRICLGLEHASRHRNRWMTYSSVGRMLDLVERRSRSL